ncbi:MAG: Stp1/IreP family PP2C-type Ser/Thr phosphatase [Planctomycetota bacterium]|jgi:protein phosphatase
MTRPDLALGQMTHVGMERSVNQDYYGFFEPEDDETFARLGRLIVVCDGMGGHAGGEIASQLATETIIASYQSTEGEDLAAALKKSIEDANAAIWAKAEAEPELRGMGTTAVCMVLRAGQAIFAHVGDSRAYRVRGETLDAMTLDHSLVQKWVNDGAIQEADMEDHEEKNVILRSVGVQPTVEVDVSTHPYEAEDIYILSSDGLTGLVSKEECRQVAAHYRDAPGHAAGYLVQMANQYGGYDNVTVQVARVRAMTVEKAEALPPLPDPNAVPAGPQSLEEFFAAAQAAAMQAAQAATDAAYAASNAAQAAANAAHAAQASAAAVAAIGGFMAQQAEARAAAEQAAADAAQAEVAAAAAAAAAQTATEAAVAATEEVQAEEPAGSSTEPVLKTEEPEGSEAAAATEPVAEAEEAAAPSAEADTEAAAAPEAAADAEADAEPEAATAEGA